MHLVFYFFSMVALFLFLVIVKAYNPEKKSSYLHQLQYLYIPKQYSFFLIPLIFSMAGFPPLYGFFTKYFLLLETLNASGILFVALVLILNIISSFYYLRLVKNIFFTVSSDEKIELQSSTQPNLYNVSFTIFAIIVTILGGG